MSIQNSLLCLYWVKGLELSVRSVHCFWNANLWFIANKDNHSASSKSVVIYPTRT